MCERFLTIDMLPKCQSCGSYPGMGMIGCCNHHSVNRFTHFIEHLAPVPVSFCIGKLFETCFGILPVNIAKCHDVFSIHTNQVRMSFTTDTYTGNIQFITWSFISKTAYNFTWEDCDTAVSYTHLR